ncbi:MAG: Cysteine desulfurase IscS [Chlamydiae bacterium]|nr:Cysteine desulfurase IscS [Chlamydiota bacterium]
MENFTNPTHNPPLSPSLEKEYEAILRFAGAQASHHFSFAHSSAEAVNHAVLATYLEVSRKTGKNHFLASGLEEAPAILSMERLQELGCVFEMVPVGSDGMISPETLAEAFTPRTAFFLCSWGCGLTGVLQPVEELASLCQERGVLFHVEASHVLGKGPFRFSESGGDLLSFSGGLFSKQEIPPFILGASTPVQEIEQLSASCQKALSEIDTVTMEVNRLRNLFEGRIQKEIVGARVVFGDQKRLPHISTMIFPMVHSDVLLYLLSRKGVYATFGGGERQHLPHLLQACGVKKLDSLSALSFAFTAKTTEEEILEGVEKIVETVHSLQNRSRLFFEEALA